MYVSIFERVYTARGKEKGRVEERAEIARNMLNKGYSAKDILECTRMQNEELDTLMKERTEICGHTATGDTLRN